MGVATHRGGGRPRSEILVDTPSRNFRLFLRFVFKILMKLCFSNFAKWSGHWSEQKWNLEVGEVSTSDSAPLPQGKFRGDTPVDAHDGGVENGPPSFGP